MSRMADGKRVTCVHRHLETSGPQVSGNEWDHLRGMNVTTVTDWHDELVLMAELSNVNNQIARFVLRLLDADAGRAEEVSVSDEGILGVRLVDLGYALQHRAVYRAAVLENGGKPIEVPGARQIESGRRMSTAGGSHD
jgi:hypothetical protein